MVVKINPFTAKFDIVGTVSLAAGAVDSLDADDTNTATPAGGTITISGGTNIDTTAAGSTITVNFDGTLPVASGGTGATTLTDGGIILGSGTGAVTVTGQPTNGQLLIGSTGVDPVLATLNEGEGIDITNGAGTITIAGEDASTTNKGIASFATADFGVTSGAVSLNDAVVKSVSTDGSAATPSTHAFTIAGGTGITTSGSGSTVTIAADSTLTTANADSGSATPAAGALTFAGGTGITTSATGSTVTTTLDTPVSVANGGTGATTLTDGGIILGSGTGAVTATGQPTNGQVLIGSTGVDPVLGTLTGGTGLSVTNGAGSITIDLDSPVTVANGGTGQTSYTNGQLLIGNTTGNTLTKATLTEGEGIDITNGTGTITIAGEDAGEGTGSGNKGIASFETSHFDVSSGHVTLVSSGSGKFIQDFSKTLVLFSDCAQRDADGRIGGTGWADGGDDTDFKTGDNEQGHPGIIRVNSSTTSHRGISTNVEGATDRFQTNLGGGEIKMKCWLKDDIGLSAGAWFFGLSTTINPTTTGTDIIGFFVDDFSSSNEIIARTTSGGTDTDTSTGVNLSSSWLELRIEINSDATSVAFYINDALEATHTTNIPTATLDFAGQYFHYNTGTAASNYTKLDYIEFTQELTGDRA